MHFNRESRIFVLRNWHKMQRRGKRSSVIFFGLTPFSQLQFKLIGCMILMEGYDFLTTAAKKWMKHMLTVIIATVGC